MIRWFGDMYPFSQAAILDVAALGTRIASWNAGRQYRLAGGRSGAVTAGAATQR